MLHNVWHLGGMAPLPSPLGPDKSPPGQKPAGQKPAGQQPARRGQKPATGRGQKTRHGKSEGFKVMIDVGTGTVGLDVQRNVLLLGVSDVARRRMTRYVPATYVKSKCEYGYTIQRTQRVEQVCHSGRAYIHAYGQVWINCRG